MLENAEEVLIHFIYGEGAVLEPYQQSIVEFVCLSVLIVVAVVFVKFIYNVVCSLFRL